MKKSLLSTFALILTAAGLNAQTADIHPIHKNISVQGKMYTLDGKKLVPTSRGVDDISTWYNFTSAYKEGTLLGQDLSTYVNFIWPDTTAYIVYDDGSKTKIGFHVVGSTFDPKDSNFLAISEKVLYKFNPYTVDSIAFTQFYIRQLDKFNFGSGEVTVVDTLYIQYFDVTGIDVKSFYYTAQVPRVNYYYGMPKDAGFSTKSLLSNVAIKTDTVFLDQSLADSVSLNGAQTSFFGRLVQFPVGITAKSTSTIPVYNNITAFALVYKPMRMTQLGDTLIAYNGSNWNKKYNMYGVRLGYLTGHDQEITTPYRINNFFVSNYQLRYGQTVGIFKSYMPGTIFSNTIFMPNYLHITTTNLSSKDLTNGMSNLVVYPNPSSVNSTVDVNFTLSATSSVTLTITDLNGRVVSSTNSKIFGAGNNTVNISTNGLSKGVYLVVAESSNGKSTAKLNIQ